MLSEKLKLSTRASHHQLEKMMVLRLKGIRDTSDYTALLGLFYAYFGGLEILVEKFVDKTILPDYQLRRKTSALAADILSFDVVLPALQKDADMPRIGNHYAAMGALYVMEGSTLGGSIISKMIQDKLGNLHNGLSFFNGYGNDTIKMWLLFKRSLDEATLTEEQEVTVIGSADNTFLQFGLLLQNNC